MLSKGEILCRPSLRQSILAIVFLSTGVWWAAPDSLAQEAAPAALSTAAHSTVRSFEWPESSTAPHLVIGMVDRGDEVASPAARISMPQAVDAVASVSRVQKDESGPLLLSRLFAPAPDVRGLTNFRAEGTIGRGNIQTSPDPAGAKVYSLLDDGSAAGAFQYGYRSNYFQSKQRLADSEFFAPQADTTPRPLFQVEFGGWQLPVVLSGAAVSNPR